MAKENLPVRKKLTKQGFRASPETLLKSSKRNMGGTGEKAPL